MITLDFESVNKKSAAKSFAADFFTLKFKN